uniref:Uncharacterized protein n=1 Tax=Romanomermis culicivorax TaxID=13658 RepID=A0A915K8R2_ROMCU
MNRRMMFYLEIHIWNWLHKPEREDCIFSELIFMKFQNNSPPCIQNIRLDTSPATGNESKACKEKGSNVVQNELDADDDDAADDAGSMDPLESDPMRLNVGLSTITLQMSYRQLAGQTDRNLGESIVPDGNYYKHVFLIVNSKLLYFLQNSETSKIRRKNLGYGSSTSSKDNLEEVNQISVKLQLPVKQLLYGIVDHAACPQYSEV